MSYLGGGWGVGVLEPLACLMRGRSTLGWHSEVTGQRTVDSAASPPTRTRSARGGEAPPGEGSCRARCWAHGVLAVLFVGHQPTGRHPRTLDGQRRLNDSMHLSGSPQTHSTHDSTSLACLQPDAPPLPLTPTSSPFSRSPTMVGTDAVAEAVASSMEHGRRHCQRNAGREVRVQQG